MKHLDMNYLNLGYELESRIINPLSSTIYFDGKSFHVRRKELELLALLLSLRGEIVERELFIEYFWKGNSAVGEPGLTRTMGGLRQTLVDKNPNYPLIRTIPRHGYQFNPNIKVTMVDSNLSLNKRENMLHQSEWKLIELISKVGNIEKWHAISLSDNQKCQVKIVKE